MKMKRKMNWVLIVLILVGLTTRGFAAEEKIFTLNQAIEIALKANPGLQQAGNQVKLSEISVKQKKANFYPDLSISANASQWYGKISNLQTNQYENEDSGNLSLMVSTSVNVFNGFYDTASLQQSKFELKAAEENFSRSSQAIIFETIQRYIQVVTARELINVEKENLEAQQLQLTRIEDFFKAGRRPITDLHQQKAEISRSEYQLLNAERNYQVFKLLLMQTLGLEPDADTHYQVSDLDIDNLIKEVKVFNKKNVLTEAPGTRPDVNARRMEIEAAQKGIKAAKSGYWPRLSLFADLGTNYSSLDEYWDFSNQFFVNNPNVTIGLSLSVPVFDKGITKNNVAAARVKLKNRELELEKLKHQVSVEVQQAVEDYRTAVKQLNAAENQLTYSRSALESIEARYNVNAATMVELIQARARYLQSAYDQVTAKYNVLIQAIAVSFYKGNTNEVMAMILRGE